MSVSHSRRRFMHYLTSTIAGMRLSPFSATLLTQSLLSHAHALDSSAEKGLYVHWTFPGGPPRWMFDLLLTPDGKTSKNFVAGNFGTRINVSGANTTLDYEVQKHQVGAKSIYLPPVWNMGASGQDYSDILSNILFVRGMHMEIDNHYLSALRQVCPVVGGISVPGAVADTYSRPIPGIIEPNIAPSRSFKSIKGYVPSEINYRVAGAINPVRSALAAFNPIPANRPAHMSDQVALQEQAFQQLENFAQKQGIPGSTLVTMYDNAMDLISERAINVANNWTKVYSRYHNLISTALSPAKGSLPGIYDKAVSASATDARFSYGRSARNPLAMSDIRDILQPGAFIPRLAENFALSEIMLNRFTSNLTLSVPPLSGIKFPTETVLPNDQHFMGSVLTTMLTTIYYRAFLAGLTEQIRVLKAQKLFDKTVVHISAEFSRTPLASGAGSDHSFFGSNATLISGMIDGPAVVGNIQKASYSSYYAGTFGVATNYNLDGMVRPIQVNDVALTITSMLGVNPVITNGRSLLKDVSGKWRLRKAEAKNE